MALHDERYEDGEDYDRFADYDGETVDDEPPYGWPGNPDTDYERFREDQFDREAYDITDPKHPDYLAAVDDFIDNLGWSFRV